MTAYQSGTAPPARQQPQLVQTQQQAQAQAATAAQRTHSQRLIELLDGIKQEFDFAYLEASNVKQLKDDYDVKYSQQTAEMQQMRQTVYELEMAHRKIKDQYEDEIVRLKNELDNRDRQHHLAQQQQQQQAQQAQQQHAQQQAQQHAQQHAQQQQAQQQQQLQAQAQAMHASTSSNGQNLYSPYQQNPPALPSHQLHPGQSPAMTQQPPVPGILSGIMPPLLRINGFEPKGESNAGPLSAAHPVPLSALKIIDPTQYVVPPLERALHVKPTPPFLADLEVSKANPDFKKQKMDYYVLYNPALERDMDVEMVHSMDHSLVVCCVRFSKDGQFIATGCNKTTQVFNVETGELVAKLIDDQSQNHFRDSDVKGEGDDDSAQAQAADGDLYIRLVCFLPDGKYLATGAEDKLIRIWDLATKRITKVLRGHEQDIYSLDFFPGGNRLVLGSGDRTVRVWDLELASCSLTLLIEDGVTTVTTSPDGQLIAAGLLDKTVRVWDLSTGFLVERLDLGNDLGNGHEDSVYLVAFTIDGKQIASGSLDRTVKLWDLEGKQDGSGSASSSSKKSTCEVTYVGHKDFVLSVCLTPDNEYILLGSKDRGVIFWDQRLGNPLLMLQGHRNSVISVAVSLLLTLTGGIFATGLGDCKARLWRWKRKSIA